MSQWLSTNYDRVIVAVLSRELLTRGLATTDPVFKLKLSRKIWGVQTAPSGIRQFHGTPLTRRNVYAIFISETKRNHNSIPMKFDEIPCACWG